MWQNIYTSCFLLIDEHRQNQVLPSSRQCLCNSVTVSRWNVSPFRRYSSYIYRKVASKADSKAWTGIKSNNVHRQWFLLRTTMEWNGCAGSNSYSVSIWNLAKIRYSFRNFIGGGNNFRAHGGRGGSSKPPKPRQWSRRLFSPFWTIASRFLKHIQNCFRRGPFFVHSRGIGRWHYP